MSTPKALLVAAHPDDTEFICGGTVATLIGRGWEVFYLVITSGEAGIDVDIEDETIRESEQLAASAVLGVRNTKFLRFTDGAISPSAALRHAIAGEIRRWRPETVITHSPEFNSASIRFSHPDHLAVGAATLAAVYPDARNGKIFPDLLQSGLQPHVVNEVWMHGGGLYNHVIDISDSFELKMRAIECHVSQLRNFSPDPLGFFQAWALKVAEDHQIRAGAMAEQYQRMDTS